MAIMQPSRASKAGLSSLVSASPKKPRPKNSPPTSQSSSFVLRPMGVKVAKAGAVEHSSAVPRLSNNYAVIEVQNRDVEHLKIREGKSKIKGNIGPGRGGRAMESPTFTLHLGRELQKMVAETSARWQISEDLLLKEALAMFFVIAQDAEKDNFYSTRVVRELGRKLKTY